jgi:hypothetical protein
MTQPSSEISQTLQLHQCWQVATFLNKGETTQYIWLKIGLGGESLHVMTLGAIPFLYREGKLPHSQLFRQADPRKQLQDYEYCRL